MMIPGTRCAEQRASWWEAGDLGTSIFSLVLLLLTQCPSSFNILSQMATLSWTLYVLIDRWIQMIFIIFLFIKVLCALFLGFLSVKLLKKKKNLKSGVPTLVQWINDLACLWEGIWHCYPCDIGCTCGWDLIPWPRNFLYTTDVAKMENKVKKPQVHFFPLAPQSLWSLQWTSQYTLAFPLDSFLLAV